MIRYFFFILVFIVVSCRCEDDERYLVCNKPLECGNQKYNISYPFWGANKNNYCGQSGFELICHDNRYLAIDIGGQLFGVLPINVTAKQISVHPINLLTDHCSDFENLNLTNLAPFRLAPYVTTLKLAVNCDPYTSKPGVVEFAFNCTLHDETRSYYTIADSFIDWKACASFVDVPVRSNDSREIKERKIGVQDGLIRGFELEYETKDRPCPKCESSGGICGSDSHRFRCFCKDKPYDAVCHKRDVGIDMKTKVIVAVVAVFVGILFAFGVCWLYQKRKKKRLAASSLLLSRKISSDPSSVAEDIEKGGVPGVHLFTYAELEEATNYFDSSKELGDGGFCTVYLGKLRDGRAVAVKRLYESNFKRVDQFLNEVEIITRLRHKNLVNLYGCTSSHSRELLLVYEFVSNGTLADHIHGQRAKPNSLPWPIRLKIAVQTANALSYLHASDIIHRDVKTNNILLDDNFYVKVADFGLSRSFPTNVSHVSTAPQGTPGYVDPDYHQCYQLTDKSDVYSFGVVLVELISSMPAVDITRHRHEINLSNMAISKIQHQELHELVDLSLGFDTDSKVKATMTSVAELAFQCLQGEKDLRPSMSECLDTLQRIQNDAYSEDRVYEMDFPDDDVISLKTFPFEQSPVSVTAKWESRDPTPNPSNL